MSADRNLLFAILAHQLDFVDTSGLLESMNRWMLNKSKSIGSVLVESGCLDESTRVLIDELVDKHVASHNENVKDSLASIGIPPSIKDFLTQLEAPEFQDSVSLPDTLDFPPSTYAAQPVANRFRILRPHASGGIGQVYVAEDRELTREVALKELRRKQSDSDEHRTRFQLEGEITGQLEHPGIVPVYARGNYSDGRPYYVMRFVRGETFEEEIRRFHQQRTSDSASPRAGLHKLITHLVKVCQAIEYAHSRGVLHRDIKPNNIMLGRYGETLVLDWGLAKSGTKASPADSAKSRPVEVSPQAAGSITRMGSVFGTPAYMPPEQASGELDLISERSDVYSLGATLHQILTGEPPFRGMKMTPMLEAIRAGKYVSPAQIDASVQKPLDAICRHAMAHSPDDRYPSAIALADDLEKWLADEPVSVWREPILQRAWRWSRRHQTLVTSLSASLMVALISLAAGLVLLSSSWQRERTSRQAAESSFAQARSVVDEFFTEVSEDVLLEEPGLQPMRKTLLSKALKFYEQFVEDSRADEGLSDEIALSYLRIGQVQEQMESPDVAMSAFERAQQMLTGASQRLALSDAVNSIARIHLKQNDLSLALSGFDRAREIRQQLSNEDPEDVEIHRKLASSMMNVAAVRARQGDSEQARDEFLKAQTLREQWLQRSDSVLLKRDFAMGEYNLGVIALQDASEGNADDARTNAVNHLTRAVEGFESVLQRQKRDFATEQRLAEAHRLLGQVRVESADGDLEEWQAAADHFGRSADILNSLVIRNPDVVSFRSALASTQMDRAVAQFAMSQEAEALVNFRSAVAALERLVTIAPDVPNHKRNLAVALLDLSRQIESLPNRVEEASVAKSRARKLMTELVDEFPDDDDYRQWLEESESEFHDQID